MTLRAWSCSTLALCIFWRRSAILVRCVADLSAPLSHYGIVMSSWLSFFHELKAGCYMFSHNPILLHQHRSSPHNF